MPKSFEIILYDKIKKVERFSGRDSKLSVVCQGITVMAVAEEFLVQPLFEFDKADEA